MFKCYTAKEVCVALFPYEAVNSDELSLAEGDIVTILSREVEDKGWWKGELKGKIGVFPDNFVQIMNQDEVSFIFTIIILRIGYITIHSSHMFLCFVFFYFCLFSWHLNLKKLLVVHVAAPRLHCVKFFRAKWKINLWDQW